MDGGDGGEVASAAVGPPAPLDWKFSQVFGERRPVKKFKKGVDIATPDDEGLGKDLNLDEAEGAKIGNSAMELPVVDAEQLFLMIFSKGVSKDMFAQWCNQGIRFSSDPETSMGLVQQEGGPCGVLAAIQVKY